MTSWRVRPRISRRRGVSGVVGVGAPARVALELTLVGVWHRFAADDPRLLGLQVRAYARRQVGRRDQDASARAAVRERLREVVKMAGERRARAVFVCDEVSPGVELPVVITVFAPENLATPQASSTADVVAALRASLMDVFSPGEPDSVVEVPAAGSVALRVTRLDQVVAGAEPEAPRVRHLRADYWVVFPGTTEVALVTCFTPLGDIAHTMLRMFDAIMERACVVAVLGVDS